MPCYDPRDAVVYPTARVSQADHDLALGDVEALQDKLDGIASCCRAATAAYPTRGHVVDLAQAILGIIDDPEPLRPENFDEIEACVSILWGEEGDGLETKGDVRAACEGRIRDMRAGRGADEVRGRG